MKEPAWVPKDFVLALHEDLLAEYGGAPGIRDEALLESALARPHHLFAYENPSYLRWPRRISPALFAITLLSMGISELPL